MYGRFWTLNVIVGLVGILARVALIAWLLLHPTPPSHPALAGIRHEGCRRPMAGSEANARAPGLGRSLRE